MAEAALFLVALFSLPAFACANEDQGMPPSARTFDAAVAADPNEVFNGAAETMKALNAYRVDMSSSMLLDGDQGETHTEIQADVQTPDKMRGVYTVSAEGEDAISVKFIRADGREYASPAYPARPEDDFWTLGALFETDAISEFFKWFEDDSPYRFIPEEIDGVEEFDGVPSYRIKGAFEVKGAPSDIQSMDARVWTGAGDSYIRKISAAVSVKGLGSMDIEATYSDFNGAGDPIAAPAEFVDVRGEVE